MTAGIANRLLSLDFGLPLGRRLDSERPAGYYIDFGIKATDPRWPPPALALGESAFHVEVIQYGLGAYERYLESRQGDWLDAALAVGSHLLASQATGDGPHDGAWVHIRPLHHTYRLPAPWISAMAQGEGASLLVRLHLETGEDRFAEAALRALKPIRIPSDRGGAHALLDGRPFPEEYPTTPPSFVLNGAIFALWGFLDVGLALDDTGARDDFATGLDTLARNIHRWDTGRWSRYDLFPHARQNVVSWAYHTLHVNQLRALDRLTPRPELSATLQRFERYSRSRTMRMDALRRKVLFRLAVPRNSVLAGGRRTRTTNVRPD